MTLSPLLNLNQPRPSIPPDPQKNYWKNLGMVLDCDMAMQVKSLFESSEDGGTNEEAEDAGGEVVLGIVAVVPGHFVELEGS